MMAAILAATANADADINVAQQVGFWIIATAMVVAGIKVVTSRNVVHAALFLVVVLLGAAAQFLLLAAEFVAVTQVLVYAGAIVVLLLFGVMLTRAPLGGDADLSRRLWVPGALTALGMLGLLGYTLLDGFGGDRLPTALTPAPTEAVSDAIFSQYLLPFEVIGVLLTATLIGAIVLARKD